ncbi:MAG: M20 family metallopeptidase [Chloroflexi bacterium]|nr:M20 family metallopeptidase [Chloroflexota bacterium]
MKEFLSYAQSHTDDIVDTLRQIVELESFSGDKAGVDALSAYIGSRLEDLGARIEVVPQTDFGNHMLADIGDGPDQVLILCHMDTVWPRGTTQQRPFRVQDGFAYGPGVLDMKAGIAITLHALGSLRELERLPKQRVRILFNSDEELGSTTSQQLIQDEAKKSTHVFCLEPSFGKEGALKTARKGVGMFTVKVTGRAAHAGNDPQNGISAVEEMAHQIIKLHSLTNYETGTTVNVGVANGGSVRNQVAPFAEGLVDLRVTSLDEAKRAEEAILGLTPVLPGARVEVSGGLNRPPMERTDATAKLFENAKSIAQAAGITLTETQVGGGSDGQFAAAVGVPVLDGMGGVGEGPHAENEYIYIDALPQRVALLAALLAEG